MSSNKVNSSKQCFIDYKHLITKYAVMWELDPLKCSGGSYFRSNWETTGGASTYHHLTIFKFKHFEFRK